MTMLTAIPNGNRSRTVMNNDCCNPTLPFSIGNARFMALPSSKVISHNPSYSESTDRPYQSYHINYQGPPSYATVVPLDRDSHVTEIRLRQVLEAYRSADDVFRDDFLNVVIFTGLTDGTSLDISPAAHKLLVSLGTSWIEVYDTDGAYDTPPPGPDVTAEQHLLEVFHDDVQGAFMHSLVPASNL